MVKQMAEMFRLSGNEVFCEGTEHIFVIAEGSEPSAAIHNLIVDCDSLTNIPQSWIARNYHVISETYPGESMLTDEITHT